MWGRSKPPNMDLYWIWNEINPDNVICLPGTSYFLFAKNKNQSVRVPRCTLESNSFFVVVINKIEHKMPWYGLKSNKEDKWMSARQLVQNGIWEMTLKLKLNPPNFSLIRIFFFYLWFSKSCDDCLENHQKISNRKKTQNRMGWSRDLFLEVVPDENVYLKMRKIRIF